MHKARQHVVTALIALATFSAAPAYSQSGNGAASSAPTSDARKAVNKAAVIVSRQAAGATIGAATDSAVGKVVGRVVGGGPVGAAVGIVLTPSEIGCGEGETCR